jgi:hypothetical protein
VIDINDFLSRTYGPQPCFELVADVIQSEGGELPVGYRTINRSVRQMASEFRLALHKTPHGYVEVTEPAEFAIVLLGKTEKLGVHHCGIYLDGKVLHALPGITLHQELASIHDVFAIVQFWAKP